MPTITPTKTPKVVAKSNAKPAINNQVKAAVKLTKPTQPQDSVKRTSNYRTAKPLVSKAGFTFSKRRLEYGGKIAT